ncbi:restriction endonuclease subunit S [Minisyncoccus archaeiphilus]|uniref:restriction endonuclease subunit S n=1 Tax=Minisyncoccus archaeiphilus TaxID=3238481 RepID=UPI00399C72E1
MKNNKSQKNIPTGWKQVTLGDLFDFKNGLNSEKENFGYGMRFINIMEILNHDFLVAKDIPGRINVNPKRSKENIVEYGDVLFNRTSETPDEVGMTSVYLDTEPVVFGGFVIRAKPKTKDLNDLFKKYCFSSEAFRKEVIKQGQGVVRGNIGQNNLRVIPFLLPPKEEQARIVSILETWNQVIEKLVNKISIKKKIKISLMQDLLTGKFRLPGFTKKWEIVSLGDILKERNERDVESEKILLYSLTIENGVCPKRERYDRSFLVKSDSKVYKKTYKNDIVYNPANLRYGAIAHNKNENPVLLSPIYQVLFIKDEKEINIDFIGQLLTWERQVRKMSAYAEGTLIERMEVKIDSFKNIQIDIPNKKEQDAIANILNTANKEIALLEEKLLFLQEQKRYLLNNLITGTIRTPETLSVCQ